MLELSDIPIAVTTALDDRAGIIPTTISDQSTIFCGRLNASYMGALLRPHFGDHIDFFILKISPQEWLEPATLSMAVCNLTIVLQWQLIYLISTYRLFMAVGWKINRQSC